jgi:hypothetical protein
MIETLDVLNDSARTLAVATSAWLAVSLWRRRDEPTARPLCWAALGLLGYASLTGVIATASTDGPIGGSGLFGDGAVVVAALALHVLPLALASCWLLFALEYTGRTSNATAAVSAVLALQTVLFVVLAGNVVQTVVPSPVSQILLLVLAVSVWAELLVSGLLFVSAAFQQPALPLGQGSLLAAGPSAFFIVTFLGGILSGQSTATAVPVGGVDLLPVGFTLSASAVLVALNRYRVFETLPVATRTGREQVVESVSRGIVVIDRQRRLHDCNQRAADQLHIDQSTALREPLSTVQPAVPDIQRLVNADEPVRVQLPEGPLVLLAATEIRNEGDQLVGYVLTTQDVTRRYNRERRLELLNQLLADVTHDRMETVSREVTTIAEGESATEQPAGVGDQIWETTTDLATLVARTREIEETLAGEPERTGPQRTDVSATVDMVVEELVDEATALVTRVPDDQHLTPVAETLVEIATRALLEDAIETHAGTVALEVARPGSEAIEIRIDVRTDSHGTLTAGAPVLDELSIQVARLAVDSVGGAVVVDRAGHTETVRVQLPTERDEEQSTFTDPRSEQVVQS